MILEQTRPQTQTPAGSLDRELAFTDVYRRHLDAPVALREAAILALCRTCSAT